MEEPELLELGGSFRINLYRFPDRTKVGKSTDKINESVEKVRVSTEKVRINVDILNEGQKRIVQYSDDRGRVTNKEVQKLLKVKESRALKILRELVEMEALKKGRKI